MGAMKEFLDSLDAPSVEQVGRMSFWLEDYSNSIYNESIDCTFPLYGVPGDEVMPIETYVSLCRHFARAMGFMEPTIEKYFGSY